MPVMGSVQVASIGSDLGFVGGPDPGVEAGEAFADGGVGIGFPSGVGEGGGRGGGFLPGGVFAGIEVDAGELGVGDGTVDDVAPGGGDQTGSDVDDATRSDASAPAGADDLPFGPVPGRVFDDSSPAAVFAHVLAGDRVEVTLVGVGRGGERQ